MFTAMLIFMALSVLGLAGLGLTLMAAIMFDRGSDTFAFACTVVSGAGIVGTATCALLWGIPVLIGAAP